MIFREFDGNDNDAYKELLNETIAAMCILHLRYKYPLKQVRACRDTFDRGLDVMLALGEQVSLPRIRKHCRLLDEVDAYLKWSWFRRVGWNYRIRFVQWVYRVRKGLQHIVRWFQGEEGRERLKVVAMVITAIAAVATLWLTVR